ncbi:unnamed protein product [Cladocopium goreaui]|uniref:Uncharacterized protein n=1 Tax=Cladocopium goreaui TaxID=2562237 RepID=A0A9P1BPT0_9DINO|nr:unnamed protein product [Cladocopium goreaui]
MALLPVDMQGVVQDLHLDIQKLFTRVHQLEIRQVAGKRDVETKLHKVEQRQDEELTSLRASTAALERKDSVQDALLETLSKNSLEQNVQELALQCRELDKTCLKHAELLESLEARIKPLEFAKDETNNFKQAIYERLDEMTSILAGKDVVEGQAALIKACEKKLTVHTDRLKSISQVLDHQGHVLDRHGVSGEADSLSQRQDKAEVACANAMRSSTAARQEVESVVSRVDEGLLRMDAEISDTKEDMSNEFKDLNKRVEIIEEGFAHVADQLQRAQICEPDVSMHEGSPGGNDRINTGLSKAGVSSAEIVQCLEDMQDLVQWRSQVRDEMDRLHRLGRIMEDRLEAFDVLERRTEDLAQHLEGKGPRDPSPPRGARSRSSSPGWRALRSEHPDLTLTGKGSSPKAAQPPGYISSPNFAGTGFAKVPPRRPYSAGAIRGDAPSPLQQLREKILQAVPALPPELQKQLEAANKSATGNGVFPRPPAAGAPAGAAFAICRPGSRSGPAMRRPVSAR